jgi:hypothetical protein
MVSDLHSKSEDLPVYTDKKWVPNKQDLEEENIKDGPTFAKLGHTKDASVSNTNITVTELPDKEQEQEFDEYNLLLSEKQKKVTNPEYKHHVGRSVNHINNMVIKEAILAASEKSNENLITKMA